MRLNWSATCWASLKLRGMTRWTWTSESPLPTGRSVRVRLAAIGSSSAKMSSISSRRARREVGRRRTEPGRARGAPRRPPRSRSRARSLPRIRDRSRGPRQGRSRPALYARCRVVPWLVACFGLEGPTPLRIIASLAPIHTKRAVPEPDDRRSLLDRDLANPARCPSRGGSRPCSAASSARRAKWGREASGSWLNGGIVIRPADPDRAALDEVAEVGRRDPALALLAGDVDLDQDLGLRPAVALPSCSSAESLATEWIRRQSGSSCLTLRLCRLPMKSHSKASPQRSCLAARSCWRFSPTRRHARLGQRPHLLERHVLGGGQDLDPVARRARAPAPGWRRSSPASMPWIRPGIGQPSPSMRQTSPAWRPVRPRRGGARRRAPARSWCRARPTRPARPRPRASSRAAATSAQVEKSARSAISVPERRSRAARTSSPTS